MKVIRKITRNIRHSLVDHLVDSLMNAMRNTIGVTTNAMNTMVCNSSNVCSMMDSLVSFERLLEGFPRVFVVLCT